MARATPKKPAEAPVEDWAVATEQQVLDQALKLVPHDGWTSRMAKLAGKACGLSEGETELLLPQGPADLAALLSRRHDAEALKALESVDPGALKIRERIARAVEARLTVTAPDEAAGRRCNWVLAMPMHA